MLLAYIFVICFVRNAIGNDLEQKYETPTCGANETYVYCKVGCPTSYCPVDDNLAQIACDPPYPCPSGCACKDGYLRLSYEDETCILASECPPVKCSRPNEEWNPNLPSCSQDRCAYRNSPCDFPIPIPPKCTCIQGYFRNDDDVCVPESECPPSITPGFPECSDPNAYFKECPSPCQVSCDSPNEDVICIQVCQPNGCVCKPGYLKSGENCVKPEECPGGSPTCGGNKTYVRCKQGCFTNYCPTDDSLEEEACRPSAYCPAGCDCKEGYLMTNDLSERCILASECPPVECTRPNEIWNSNPKNCLQEECHKKNEKCENSKFEKPKCVCKEGFLRNKDNICVPASEC